MKKKKSVQLVPGGGYGWAGMSPPLLTKRLKQASKRFAAFAKNTPVDAVAFTGSSGCAIGFHLAAQYNQTCIYVRKVGEKTHGSPVECNTIKEVCTYMIVDDFMSSGATVRRIIREVPRRIRTPVKNSVSPR